MKGFVNKLIERLEELQQCQIEKYTKSLDEGNLACIYDKTDIEDAKVSAVWKVLDIATQLAEEYNNESVKGDLISKSAVIKELNEIYLDNPWDNKEDILEKAIGIVDHIPTVYVPAPYTEGE